MIPVPAMTIIRFVTICLLLSLLCGCSLFLADPTVQVKDVSIVGVDAAGVDVELYLAVTNPNPYRVRLTGYSYDLKVMALPLAKGGAREPFEFKAGSTTDLRLPVKISLKTLYELIKRGPDPDNIPYLLDAGLEVDSLFGTHLIPIEKKGTFKVPERYRPEQYFNQLKKLVSGLTT